MPRSQTNMIKISIVAWALRILTDMTMTGIDFLVSKWIRKRGYSLQL